MIERLTRQQLHAAGGVLLVLLLGLGVVFGAAPLIASHAALRAAQADLASALARAESTREQLASSAAALARTRARIDQSRVQLRPVSQLNQQVQTLALLATQHSLRLEQIRPGATQTGRRAASVPLTLTGSGPLANLTELLRALTRSHPDVVLTSFRIHATENPGADGRAPVREAAFTLELAWFAALDDQASPAPVASAPTP
jgi:Tfp pilus assembly protein PilO